MPTFKENDFTVSWENKEDKITLSYLEDESQEDISDLFVKLLSIYYEGEMKDWGYNVHYPEDIRIYKGDEEISLEDAHYAFEVGFKDALKRAIENLKDNELEQE